MIGRLTHDTAAAKVAQSEDGILSERDGLDDLIAVIRSRNARARQREVDAAVREGLRRAEVEYGAPFYLPAAVEFGLPARIALIVGQAWREQHA